MVFNWFRRQFNDKDAPTPEEEQSTTAEVKPETPAASEEDVAAEYLKWAKAAYQNIQQQQESVEAPQAELQEDVTETSPAPIEPQAPVPEPDFETPVTEEVQVDEPDSEEIAKELDLKPIVPQADEPDPETLVTKEVQVD